MRPALIVEVHCVSARLLKVIFALIVLGAALFSAPASRAEDLHYFKNYFVTGDYAVEGVGLYAKGVKGMATGTITMTAVKDVPAGADIVAAYLYWETVETTAHPSSMNGFFDFDSTGKPYPIVGDVLANPNAVPCWSNGGTGGPGTYLRVYRADVLRYLNVDANGTVRDVDYTHTITLPDSGINQPGSVPHTEGASLVVVYRQLNGSTAYKAVVIYDGAYTMTKGSSAFSQTLGGFYGASGGNGTAKMTQIVGNGQPNFAETLTVNGSPSGVSGTPFNGAAGSRWDNLTYAINLALGANQVTTQVTSGNNQVCLSWGAVLMSTNVVNTDGDGILDSWKTKGLHLNVGSPATIKTASVPATFGGCSDYPKDPCDYLPGMGAVLGTLAKPHKDIFVQIDWMHGNDGHIHAPKLAALRAIAAAFSAHQINLHFDIGKFHYQQFATPASNYMIVPAFYAEGGNLIEESSLECPNKVITNASDCEYNSTALGYLVLGWKTGIGAIENGFSTLNIPQYFAHDRKDTFHYMLLAHALAGPIDTNPGPGNGLPVTPPPSVSGVGDLFGGDVMVTLGLWRTDNPQPVIGGHMIQCIQDDPTGLVPDADLCTDQTGTSLVQAGTLFHELGHNLGLHHGGAVDTPNCMVDYPSTMNYLYQTRGLTGATNDNTGVAGGIEHIDFSSKMLLGSLNENLLYGTPLLGSLPYRLRYYGPATDAEISTGANAKANCNGTFPYKGTASVRLETSAPLSLGTAIDWSNGTNIGVLGGGHFSEDIDFDGTVGDSVAGGLGFTDHDDWGTLNLQQIGGRPNVSGLSGDVGPTDISTADLLGQSVLGQNVLGQNVLGQNVLGQSVLGQNVLGQSVLGQNVLGQNVLGQNVLGQNVLGQNVLGEVDYDTAISTLDATGASTPLVGAQSASSGAVYNRVTLTWGAPSLGQIRTYTIYRTNLQAAVLDTVVAGSVSGTPPATAFNDPVTDPNLSDIGANCLPDKVCYDTNYQYYIVASTNNNSSTPSNLVSVTVDHLYVTGFTGSVTYGDPLPNSMVATISGLPMGGITSGMLTCPNPTPRNVGSYPDTCTGPLAVVGNPATVGVTYIDGVLMITPRLLTITAGACTKTYDGTTNAPGAGTCAAATATNLAPTGWGGYTDTVSPIMEVYTNANAAGTGGSTLHVSSYTVNDENSGKNYSLSFVDTPGTISPFTLTVTAAGVNRTYNGTRNATVTFSDNRFAVMTDNFTYNYTATLASANVANAIGITATGISLIGGGAGNYALPANLTLNTSANITPFTLTVTTTGVNKTYDGGYGAMVIFSDNRFAVVTDNFTYNYMAAFATANAGNGIGIAVTGISITGGGATNYALPANLAPLTAANIIQFPLTVTGTGVNKIYDGTTNAMVTFSDNRLPVATDTFTYSYTATFASPNVGNGIGVTVTGISLTGSGSGNYTLQNTLNGNGTASTTANITPAPLTAIVTGTDSGGPPPTAFTATPPPTYSGFVNGEMPSIIAGALSCTVYTVADTASDYPISCSGLSASNYTITYSYAATSVGGSPAPLTVAVNGTRKGPIGTPTFTVTYSGFINGDLPSVVTGTLSCTLGPGPNALTFKITSCTGLTAPSSYTISYWLGTVKVL